MTGMPLTRVESGDGSWAYTFYSRQKREPFVHALDTAHRRAFCIDVPWKRSANDLWRVRPHLAAGKLRVQLGGKTVARIDTTSFRVSGT